MNDLERYFTANTRGLIDKWKQYSRSVASANSATFTSNWQCCQAVAELEELSRFSESYISQVKNGKRPPSGKLIEALLESRHYRGSRSGKAEDAVQQTL